MRQAIDHLQADRLSESEQAVTNVLKLSPLPRDLAQKTESNRLPTLVQLRVALVKLAIG